ncbi:hypothetical protein P4639_14535 [Priestia megaterium]|uniref:hypothetical protein n=1 Tax=Priestia megaterium TaxID=1404 RepID=UPI002E23E204|nr:hypothetical protein [Priestia megaterium]
MYDFALVDTYLQNLAFTESYKEKSEEDRRLISFTAYDCLLSFYADKYLTPKVIGKQTMYMIEGEAEEFAKFKRQGVSSMGLKGMSFSFDITKHVSPESIALIEQAQALEVKPSGARVGRLV